MLFAFGYSSSKFKSYRAKKLIFTDILLLILNNSTIFNCILSLPTPLVHARTPHVVESPSAIDTVTESIDWL